MFLFVDFCGFLRNKLRNVDINLDKFEVTKYNYSVYFLINLRSYDGVKVKKYKT